MNRFFQRSVGILVVATVLLAIALMILIIASSRDSTMRWDPRRVNLFDGSMTLTFSGAAPGFGILLPALAIAVLLVVVVVVTERLVSLRYRRTPPGVTRRPLAPKPVMERTRGVFAGEVTVTVLIPAHNEEASLPGTLASLDEQLVRPDRVIVVADNCVDGTVRVAREYGADVFETVGNTHKKGGALNQALREVLPALGDNDAVLVMDADTQLGPAFLQQAVQLFTSDRALMAVGGLFQGEEGGGILGQFQRNEYHRYQREIRRREGRVFVLTGTGTVFRSSALRAVAEARGAQIPGRPGDVYDTLALTEDNELTIAIKSLGGLMTSPDECVVTTEIMPSWKMLWAQRLRWQRGALENLGAYGVTPQTFRYWAQQVSIGYGVFALFAYFLLMAVMLLAMDIWVWYPFWIGIGLVFAVERAVTVWQGGWRARLLAILIIPELVYDCFLNLAFLKGVFEISAGQRASWKHVTHEQRAEPLERKVA